MADSDVIPLPVLHDWALPSHGLRIETIDAHAGGQSLRLVLNGFPSMKGNTMLERLAYAREHFDHLRRALMHEPRGHRALHGCLLTPPQFNGSHFGVLFMNQAGFSAICGHGIIALATMLLESGLAELKAPETLLRLDTAMGKIRAYGQVEHDQVDRVFFEFGPAWVVAGNQRVGLLDWGDIHYDLTWAGSFMAMVDAASLRLSTAGESSARLVEAGKALLFWMNSPSGVAGREGGAALAGARVESVVFTDRPTRRRKDMADARQVCVYENGSIDRSPGALAICARLALMKERGQIDAGVPMSVEGITGSIFRGKLVGEEPGTDGVTGGVICEIEGQAWITGRHTFLIAEDDPFAQGFSM